MKQLLEEEGMGDLSELLSGEEDLSEEDLEDFFEDEDEPAEAE